MTTRDVGIALHEELDRREKLIAVLQEECSAIRTTLTIVERGGSTPEAQNRVTRVVGRRGRPRKKAESDGGGIGAAAAVRSNGPTNSAITSGPAAANPAKRRTIDEKRCKSCGKSAAEGAVFGKHAAFVDGLNNRCKPCQNQIHRDKRNEVVSPIRAAAERHRQKEERMPLPMRKPANAGLEADVDAEDEFPGPTEAAATVTPLRARDHDNPYQVPCLQCGKKFANARELGAHQTRDHFTSEAAMSRRGAGA